MGWKGFFVGLLSLIIVGMLVVYFFVPFNIVELSEVPTNSNFSEDKLDVKMQFYDNLRYYSNEISYRIADDCTLQKKANMEESFDILEDLTILEFYSVGSSEEILVECDSKTQIEDGLFIAGEGGPTNITIAGNFNLIYNGQIVLIRESSCPNPNVGLHELLHALGFNHSTNPDNILYAISKCKQTIGDEIPKLIDELYSFPNYPDITFENVSVNMEGKYINANLSIRNEGLEETGETNLIIYVDNKIIKEINIESLKIGYGTKLSLSNIWVNKFSINEIRFVLETNLVELDKSNNEIVFIVKDK